MFLKTIFVENFFTGQSVVWFDLNALLDNLGEVFGVGWRDWRVLAFANTLTELLHAIGSEWWHQGDHFVEDAAHAPNVTLVVVWSILPHLWAGVVGCTSLRVHHASFGNFGNIEVTDFYLS